MRNWSVFLATKGDFMTRTLTLLASSLLAVCVASSANAQVTVGNSDNGNCYPFSCGPSDSLTQYQEDYNSGAFSGPFSFNSVSFGQNIGGQMDSASYTVSFYLSAVGFGGLTSNLASNEGTFLGTLGTFGISGAMPTTLTLTGNQINYNPANGTLLMNVDISNVTSAAGFYQSFFNADYTGADVTRAYSGTTYGASGDTIGALQTTFNSVNTAVPEPATWALMLLGFGMVGYAMRKRGTVRTTLTYA